MKVLKSIYNWIVNVEKDKLLHYTISLILALTIYSIASKITHSKASAIGISWFVSFIIGIAKEAYDEYKHHNAEEGDWIADVLGIVTALAYCLVMI
jgi:VanZ family protein